MINLTRGATPLAAVVALLSVGCEPAAPPPPSTNAAYSATGQTTLDVGEYVIHYNAFTTDTLAPDVARLHGIQRSHSRAMLNVTVLRKEPGTIGRPVEARVEATTSNLTGQIKNLQIRKLVEGDGEAIYYVGDVAVARDETLNFDVLVTPENQTESHQIRFRRHFSY